MYARVSLQQALNTGLDVAVVNTQRKRVSWLEERMERLLGKERQRVRYPLICLPMFTFLSKMLIEGYVEICHGDNIAVNLHNYFYFQATFLNSHVIIYMHSFVLDCSFEFLIDPLMFPITKFYRSLFDIHVFRGHSLYRNRPKPSVNIETEQKHLFFQLATTLTSSLYMLQL